MADTASEPRKAFGSYRRRCTAKRRNRFCALYGKIYRKDVLTYAYLCCKANGGAAGVDNQTLVSGYFFGNSCNLLHASMMQPFASGTI
jgi:hypothetical protein